MSYQINKTNGSLLVNLVDGQIDKNSTNIVLVGRNYTGFGEFINENFVKLLENFSNTAAPSNPMEGQLWWDSTEKKIKVYNGISWKGIGINYANSAEINKFEGDIWFDSFKKQLFAYDGSKIILIGPVYSETQGKSGFEVVSISDAQSSNTVIKLYVGAALVAIISNKTFVPIASQRVQELVTDKNPTGTIYKGINTVSDTFDFVGTSTASRSLIDTNNIKRTAEDFLSSKVNSATAGTLTIRNTGGLRIGPQSNVVMSLSQNRFDVTNQTVDQDFAIKIKSSIDGAIVSDAFYIDSGTKRIGVFTNSPQYNLDVTGSQRVTGNLTVNGNLIVDGESLQVAVTTLNVEGKTIELLTLNGEAAGDDSAANGGGLVLKSTSVTSDKTFLWNSSTNSWTSNQHVNISSPLMSYKIGGVIKLTSDSLVNVTSAPDLQSIGTLTSLKVDDITLNTRTISSPAEIIVEADDNIVLDAGISIDITNSKRITGLGDPVGDQDAVNKRYVTQSVATLPEYFSLDVTGLGSGGTLITAVANILLNLITPTSSNINKIVKVLTVSYSNATVSGVNVEAIKTVSYTAVDSNGVQNATVVQDISFSPTGASGTVTLVPTRSYMTYRSNGTVWIHQSTTPF